MPLTISSGLQRAVVALCFLIKPNRIVRGMMDSYGTGNSRHIKRYTRALASRRVSVLALCFVMKLEGIEGDDGW